jgi:asparagine synthase (glutamine-hydrolysing)
MCGITGEVAADPLDLDLFDAMLDELTHRGPDGRGVYTSDDERVALGSRRLSIIDTSAAGDMPLTNETGDVWIVYNGETYNYQPVREELQARGHEFTSETDTEVILHAYEEWGTDCVERFRGMFVFAIWDEREERLVVARDRLGIKPCYYYDADDRFVFASELKSIVRDPAVPREVDPAAVHDFLLYRYVPAPRSIWQDIRKLPPGHLLVHEDGTTEITEYWSLDEAVDARRAELDRADDPEAVVEGLLDDAVEEHLVSDVPLSVLLSGGLDSSLVTAFASRHLDETSTYSLGFDGTDDELPHARVVADAFGTAHTERTLSSQDLSDLAERLMYYYDEPIGDSSIFPTFMIMEAISEEFKVALSGDGGDEAFAGYNWYSRYRRYEALGGFAGLFGALDGLLGAVPSSLDNRYVDAVRSRLEPFDRSGLDRYRQLMAPRFETSEVTELLSDDLAAELSDAEDVLAARASSGLDSVPDLQRFDAQTFMVDDILVKVDRASMANSLEVRVPFLDHRLLTYTLALDEETLFDDGEKKHLLKRVARRVLPESILDREKQGFSAPLDELGFIDDHLHLVRNSRAAADGVFEQDALDALLAASTGSARDQAKLWLLISFELWYREWADLADSDPATERVRSPST